MGCTGTKQVGQQSAAAPLGDPSKTLLVSRPTQAAREKDCQAQIKAPAAVASGLQSQPREAKGLDFNAALEVAYQESLSGKGVHLACAKDQTSAAVTGEATDEADTVEAYLRDRAALAVQRAWRGAMARREAAMRRLQRELSAGSAGPGGGGGGGGGAASSRASAMRSSRGFMDDDDTAEVPNDAATSGVAGGSESVRARGAPGGGGLAGQDEEPPLCLAACLALREGGNFAPRACPRLPAAVGPPAKQKQDRDLAELLSFTKCCGAGAQVADE